jgi:hypothetical protein
MIVRHESDGSLVMITQNDHAKVSGHCASHWGNARFARARPYLPCVQAAYLHDLAWLREETAPRFNPPSGTTPNYQDVPNETQINEYPWASDWVARLDSYAAVLVSKHRTGIWKSRYALFKQPHYAPRQLSPMIEELVTRTHAEQEAASATFDAHEVTTNYILLQIWDLLSLYICSTEELQEACYEPVPTSYAQAPGECMRLTPDGRQRIAIRPYPFDQTALEVSVMHRRLPSCHFPDEDTFRTAYFNATPRLATFTYFDPDAA